MSDLPPLHMPDPAAAPGDFYVESACCTACGVPQVVAPDLIGWTKDEYLHCCWLKQPSTPSELEQAFAIFEAQELGCHRYAGADPEIQKRIGRENCDHPLPSIAHSVGAVIEAPIQVGFSVWSRTARWFRKLRRDP
jgi:hypothetical protein